MSAQTVTQTPATVRRTIARYRWALLLSLLVIYRFIAGSSAALPVDTSSQVSYVDPAQQSVMSYLRVHETAAATRPLDPAQQRVLSYLRMHETAAATRPLDPAQQSVLSYLRTHNH